MYETFHCPSCQAPLELPEDTTRRTVECTYCSSTVVVPDHLRDYVQTHNHADGQQKLNVMYEITQLLEGGNKIEAIKRFREEFGVGLKEAKLAVESLEQGLSNQVYVTATTTTYQPQKSSGNCLGSFIILFLLIAAGGGMFLYFGLNTRTIDEAVEAVSSITEEIESGVDGSITTNFNLVNMNGPALLLPVGDRQTADVVYTSRNLTNEMRYLHYYEGQSDTVRWRSDPLADKNADYLFADDEAIYLAIESELTAFNRSDGQQRWQIVLSDRLPYQCDDCFLSFPDALTFLTYDGKLQAIDRETGTLLWQKSITSVNPSRLFYLDGKVGVVNEDETTGMGLDSLEPATGELVLRLEPRCDHDFFDPQEPQYNDPIVVDEMSTAVYLTYGFFEPVCVQKWDFVTGEMVWNTFIETAAIRSDDMGFVQTPETLFFNDADDQVFAVNKGDGTLTLLTQITDHSMYLLDGNATVLVARAQNQQGTRRDKLWGIDALTGERLWEQVPQADTWLAPNDDNVVVYSERDGYWNANLTLAGVHLFQARHDPPRLVFETLNLQTGASSGQEDVPIGTLSETSYWFELLGWDDHFVWVKADVKQLLGVDAETAVPVSDHMPK